VGTEPFLADLLPGRDVSWSARNGITTPEGLVALRSALPRVRPQVVVLSLGSNDGPDPRRFADRLRRALAAVPAGACVVWPSIVRPPRKGPYRALNRVLRGAARRDRRLVVVGWDWAVARGDARLPDGLHPDPDGYRHRSELIAAAVRRDCPR
jgi:lysophospholipase L1-like esterase